MSQLVRPAHRNVGNEALAWIGYHARWSGEDGLLVREFGASENESCPANESKNKIVGSSTIQCAGHAATDFLLTLDNT